MKQLLTELTRLGDFEDFPETDNVITEYVPYEKTVTITEHKAPTDESIRLLNEFQEKALKNLIRKVEIKDNIIDGVLFVFRYNLDPNMRRLIFRFKLNGQEYEIEDNYEIGREARNIGNLQTQEVVKRMVSKLSTIISVYLFKSQLDFWGDNINWHKW